MSDNDIDKLGNCIVYLYATIFLIILTSNIRKRYRGIFIVLLAPAWFVFAEKWTAAILYLELNGVIATPCRVDCWSSGKV